MSSSTWQDHFKEQLFGLEAPREGSFLELALEEGRIDEKAYLEWASLTHFIPLLHPNYFTETTPEEGLLQRASHPWRSTLFPVAFWDGHLVVAGLERPESLPKNCSFVLAPREGLALWWEKLAEEATPLEGPEGIDLAGGDSESENLDLSMDSVPATGLNFSGISLANSVPHAETSAPTKEVLAPHEAQPVAIRPMVQDIPMQEVASDIRDQSISDISLSGTETKPLTNIPSTSIPSPRDEKTQVKFNPTLEKHFLTDVALNTVSFKTDIQKLFHQISGVYPQTIFFALDENKQGLLPLAWCDRVTAPESLVRVQLGTSSFFEIVATTEKPYHGYIVPNDVNSRFLDLWNVGSLPENITLVPLIMNSQLVGMALGMGPKSSYSMTTLRFFEKCAADLLKKWAAHVQNSAA